MEIIEKTQTTCNVKDLKPGDIFKSNRLGYFDPDDKVVKYDTAKLELN